MIIRYLETRGRISTLPNTMMADVMRHFHARQHLGKAVVITNEPTALAEVGHRQWQKLTRILQRRRGAASNPVEILKYTYTITQMQHLGFATKSPRDEPDAMVYFVRPDQLGTVPANCFTVYLDGALEERGLANLVAGLPGSALVVDYFNQLEAGDFGLRPRAELEARVVESWHSVEAFMDQERINIRRMVGAANPTEALDDALDILLGVEAEFLEAAERFQRTLDLARPLRTIAKAQRDQYEMLLVLAHRIQTLSPSGFSARFLRTYADDTFFLSDNRRLGEALAEIIARHERAGRWNLVRALVAV